PWAADMAALAKRPNVSCKLSGLITEAGTGWSVAMLKPYADHLIRVFGAERLMFGSDWPVLDLTANYGAWWNAAHGLTADLSEAERAAIFGGTAARFYRI
ncbi:amidohydrolase, partial [Rhizobiaceae sp. 2RAB30]